MATPRKSTPRQVRDWAANRGNDYPRNSSLPIAVYIAYNEAHPDNPCDMPRDLSADADDMRARAAQRRRPGTPNTALTTTRQRAGISIRELARRAGVDPSTVSRIESGKREGDQATLTALAEALGVPVEGVTPQAPPAIEQS